ncbi:MAG: hypothetical protein QOG50_627 [Actinomycetota bacterium]|nr:hypothetical protein [Actinomycetota bacterium]
MTNLTPDPIEPLHSELAGRLAALGKEPVDPAIASAHLTAIAAVPTGRARRPVRGRFVRGKVAAAFAAGLVLGGTSLASAGVLGNTPQNAVADAAGHVGLDLPGGTSRSTEGCGGGTYKNHGQFVAQGGDPHSPCGKPVKSKDTPGKPDDANAHGTKQTSGAGAKTGCGKPPWAGKGNHAKNTPAAVAQRKAACGDDAGTETNAPNAGATTTTAP